MTISDNDLINGFTVGNPIEIRVCRMNKSVEFQPQPELIVGNMIYQRHGNVVIHLIDQKATGLIGLIQLQLICIRTRPMKKK